MVRTKGKKSANSSLKLLLECTEIVGGLGTTRLRFSYGVKPSPEEFSYAADAHIAEAMSKAMGTDKDRLVDLAQDMIDPVVRGRGCIKVINNGPISLPKPETLEITVPSKFGNKFCLGDTCELTLRWIKP